MSKQPPQSQAGYVEVTNDTIEYWRSYCHRSAKLLSLYRSLTDSYVLEFFSKDLWQSLPASWRVGLEPLTAEQLAVLLQPPKQSTAGDTATANHDPEAACRMVAVLPLSLLAYRSACHVCSLPRAAIPSPAAFLHHLGQYASRRDSSSYCNSTNNSYITTSNTTGYCSTTTGSCSSGSTTNTCDSSNTVKTNDSNNRFLINDSVGKSLDTIIDHSVPNSCEPVVIKPVWATTQPDAIKWRIPKEELSTAGGQHSLLSEVFRRHVKPKKQHEVARLGLVTSLASKVAACDVTADIGSGCGHLARLMAYGYNMRVVCVDKEADFVNGARKFDAELEKSVRKLQRKLRHAICVPEGPRHAASLLHSGMDYSDFAQTVLSSWKHSEAFGGCNGGVKQESPRQRTNNCSAAPNTTAPLNISSEEAEAGLNKCLKSDSYTGEAVQKKNCSASTIATIQTIGILKDDLLNNCSISNTVVRCTNKGITFSENGMPVMLTMSEDLASPINFLSKSRVSSDSTTLSSLDADETKLNNLTQNSYVASLNSELCELNCEQSSDNNGLEITYSNHNTCSSAQDFNSFTRTESIEPNNGTDTSMQENINRKNELRSFRERAHIHVNMCNSIDGQNQRGSSMLAEECSTDTRITCLAHQDAVRRSLAISCGASNTEDKSHSAKDGDVPNEGGTPRIDSIDIDSIGGGTPCVDNVSETDIGEVPHIHNFPEIAVKDRTACVDSFAETGVRDGARCMRTFGVTGLHACGDLSSTLLRVFTSLPECRYIASVACCYMKLTTYKDRTYSCISDDSSSVGYPMSHKTELYELSYAARELACHAIEGYADKLAQGDSDNLKVHCYRATLEAILVQHWPRHARAGLRPVKHAHTKPFHQYAIAAVSALDEGKLQLPSEDLHSDITARRLHRWRQVVVYYTLRLMLAPVIETLLLLDRSFYLYDQGVNSLLVPIFDPTLSPRNMVLLAVKQNTSQHSSANS